MRGVVGWLVLLAWVVLVLAHPLVALLLFPVPILGLWMMDVDSRGRSIPCDLVSLPDEAVSRD